MPLKLLSPGGGSVLLQANTTSLDYTLTVPAETANLITTATSSGINASAISVGTLDSGRLPSSGINATALTTGTLPKARLPAGSTLQVLQTVVSSVSSYSGSTFQDISGMSVTITPSSSTSKILVIVDLKIGSSGNQFQNTILRNGSQIYVGDASGSRAQSSSAYYYPDGNIMVPCPSTFLDSPGTTSALTYKIQGRTDAGATWHVNRTPNDTNGIVGARTASSITVMEIAV